MLEKFKNIPVDEGTRIIATKGEKIGEYDVVYQKWFWDGVKAESIIFYNEDVKSLTKEDILKLVHSATFVSFVSSTTYSQGDTYTFINFNFKTD